ncbi:MAG: DUF4340 domain-containing protein [Planctomycetes bacterium]|nr:DUF4340 domain-containing protein [Planctomycetota bacterium]
MNWKSTIALLILAAGAGAWLWKGDTWAPRLANRTAPADPAELTALEADFTPATVTRIEIAPPGGDVFAFERTAAGWQQSGNWPLRTVEVNELVDTVATLRTRFRPVALGEGADLAPFGLADAQKPLAVKVGVKGKEKPYELLFGEPALKPGETAFTRPAFVRVNGANEVLKLGPDVMPVLRRPADSYRRRQLFADVERVKFTGTAPPFPMPGQPPEPPAPTTVTLPGPGVEEVRVVDRSARPDPKTKADEQPKWHEGGSFALRRTGPTPAPTVTEKNAEPTVHPDRLAEAWALESPVRDRTDPATLQRVLAAVPDLWAETFVPAKDASFALDHPYSIAQMLPTLEPFPAALVRFHPNAAVLDPLAAKVPAPARAKLDKSEQSVTVKTKDGLPVTVKFGGTVITTREETETVTPPIPGAEPRTETRTASTTYRYAQVEGNPQLFTLPADKVSALFVKAGELAEPRVAAFKLAEVRSVAIARPGAPAIVLNRKKGDPKATAPAARLDRWEIDQKPNPVPADTDEVEDFLSRVSGFRGAPDTDTYTRALDPATSVVVTVVTREKRPDGDPDAPAQEHKILIGAPDAARKLPVQLAGWPRVALIPDRTGAPPPGWLGATLFPTRLEPVFRRDSVAFRSRKLFDTADPATKLTGVTVDGAGGFALRHETGADARDVWKLTAPIASAADEKAAEVLRTKLADLRATEFLAESAANPAAFGLDKPKFTAALAFSNGRTYKLEVGGPRTDKKGEVYARLDGGAVFALPAAESDALAGGALTLLPLQVWAVPMEKLTGVEITREEAAKAESFALAKDGTNWKLTGPFAAPVAFLDAQPAVSALATLPAVKYETLAATDLAKYGLDKPFAKVKLSFLEVGSDGPRPTAKAVVIGGVTPGSLDRYAKLDEPTAPVFVLPAQYLAAVQTPPLSLLDRNLLLIDPAKIAKVQIAGDKPESAVTLTKGEKEKWSAEGAAFAVDSIVVTQLAAMFAPLPVEKLAAYGDAVKWADFGLDKPEYTVTVTLAGDKPVTRKLQIGKADATGGRYVRADDGPAVGVIPAFAAQALARTKLDFADRTLLTFKPDELLGLARTKGKDEFELAPGAGDGWDVTKPAKQKADKLLMEELADVLARLRADKVAAFGKKADVYKQFGLDTPEAVVTLTVGEKAEQKVLRFGRPVDAAKPDGDRYAALDGPGADAAVCVIGAALANKLLAPPVSFRDRTIVKFVDADKLELERGPRKVTFAKVNGTWKVTAPLAADAEQAALDDLVNELARLRANDWAADKPTPAELKTFGLDSPEATWTVSNGDKGVLTLRLGKRLPDGRVYALTPTGAVALLGAPQSAKVLAEYRTRKPWALDGFQADAVAFTRGDKSFAFQKTGAAWSDPAAPLDAVSTPAVTDLLAALAGLQVERYAVDADGNAALFGLDKPELKLTVLTKDGPRALEIGGFVGGTDNKQRYARVVDKGRSDVFVLSAADTARLARDRAAYLLKK